MAPEGPRHTVVSLLAALLLSAGCASPGASPAEGPDRAALDGPPTTEPDPIPAGRAAPPGTYDQPVDVLDYRIETAVSDTASWIHGRTRITARLDGPLPGPFGLDFTGLAVDGVTVDGTAVDARHAEGRLLVPLPAELAPGDTFAVEVTYRGVPDDGLIVGRSVHGEPSAFVDNWPNRARFWFPGVDHPSDKATVTQTIHAPAAWDVVANGALEAEPSLTPPGTPGPGTSGPRRSWRWRHDQPISTYNVVFGGAVMARDTVGLAACGRAPASPRPDGCVAVTTWLFPESREGAAPSFVRAAEMVDHFTELVGPFPYAKLANVQSATRFGGMENASAIFYSERALAEGRDIEGTVSHEVAHQWFGDAVTEADWRHLWLSEGFATYFGAHFFEAADGADAFRARMERARRSYLSSTAVDQPVVVPEVDDLFSLLNANNYQKGGWVLHMLRDVVGEDAFVRGIREYYRRFAGGTALTDDFRAVMEEASGADLGWFFDQWLHRPGHPVLAVGWSVPEDGGEVTVRVEQVQDERWPTFRFPLVLEVHGPDGGATHHEVVVDERSESFRLGLHEPPARIVADPDGRVLMRLADDVGSTPGR